MLLDSDTFIALIKERDRLKPAASAVLQNVEAGRMKGAYASVAVIQEVVFWLLGENRNSEIVKTVNALLNINNLEWVELSRGICLTAAALVEEYKISSFDAYHAATAISRDSKIVSSDHAYDRIRSLNRVDLSSLAS